MFQDDVSESTVFANLFGVDGVVVWGSSVHMKSKTFCSALLNFINDTYGPTTKSAYDDAVKCSNSMCSGHGNCVSDERVDIAEILKVVHSSSRNTIYVRCVALAETPSSSSNTKGCVTLAETLYKVRSSSRNTKGCVYQTLRI